MNKIILITGWLGYIWSHWVVAFEQAWYKTVIVDNLSNSNIEVLSSISDILWYKPDFYKIDLNDFDELNNIFIKYDFYWVVHFAWLKSPYESQYNSLNYFHNNVWWSICLFRIMEKYNVKNIVFSSSANTYSIDNIQPVNENSFQSTTNPYWTTKLLIEKILFDLSKFNWFKVVNLRYFNPIWAHKSWLLWEDPKWKPNNLFPYIFKVLIWECKVLTIFWHDYDTKDWTWIRDYIDIDDLVRAHLLSYDYLNKFENLEWLFESFNVWTWSWISVLDSVKIVEKTLWLKVNYIFWNRREWDIPISFCNTKKINDILWFVPKVPIETSILNSWKFYNEK